MPEPTASGDVEVLVVGGGPAGLAAALFLARHGVRVRLLERRTAISTVPRANRLHARTMELFREAGVEEAVRRVGRRIVPAVDGPHAAYGDEVIPWVILSAPALADIDRAAVLESPTTDFATLSPSWQLWCGQDRYERVLREAAVAAGAELCFGTELEALALRPDGVRATVADHTGARSTVSARYLVAADGVHSGVRQMVGIDPGSQDSAGRRVSITFHADLDALLRGRRFLLFNAVGAARGNLYPVDGQHRWVLGVHIGPETSVSEMDGPALVRRVVGDPVLPLRIESSFAWEALHRVAGQLRSGPAFLVGDSGHVHHPAGGFGANAGIQDAHNLAWKLAAVLRGWAGDPLLDSYEAERRPVALATARQAWLRYLSIRGGLTDAQRDELRSYETVSLGYRYASTAVPGADGGPVLPGELMLTGVPGFRAPHVWLDDDGGPPARSGGDALAPARSGRPSTLDWYGGAPVLLTGPDGRRWERAAGSAAAASAIPLRTHRLATAGAAAHGIDGAGAVLVRPDAVVAWRSTGPAGTGSESEVLARVLRAAVGR